MESGTSYQTEKKPTTEARRGVVTRLDKNEITGGIFEDNSYADTCLLEKVRKNPIVHEYSENLSRLSEDIGKLEIRISDGAKVVRTDNEDEVITGFNPELSKIYEEVSLTSRFQVRFNGTRVDTAPM